MILSLQKALVVLCIGISFVIAASASDKHYDLFHYTDDSNFSYDYWAQQRAVQLMGVTTGLLGLSLLHPSINAAVTASKCVGSIAATAVSLYIIFIQRKRFEAHEASVKKQVKPVGLIPTSNDWSASQAYGVLHYFLKPCLTTMVAGGIVLLKYTWCK
jgi:hypothetical protein